MTKKIIAMIPARINASRFPNKLLQILDGKPIIVKTYEAVKNSNLFDHVYVVCDDITIKNEIENVNGKAILSLKSHESGTDRIAEAVSHIECDIVVNVQGDEPFIEYDALKNLIALFKNEKVHVGSLMMKIKNKDNINNPNCVKVVVDKNNKALYFSRSVIPFERENNIETNYYQHIGVYAFKKETLLQIASLPPSYLEKIEKLENLRMLENGIDIYLAEVNHIGISIDTPEDYEKATLYIDQKKKKENKL